MTGFRTDKQGPLTVRLMPSALHPGEWTWIYQSTEGAKREAADIKSGHVRGKYHIRTKSERI